MQQCLQDRPAHPDQELPETGIPSQRSAQDNRIHEIAHEPGEIGPAPPGNYRTDEYVLLARITVQQHLKGCCQRRKQSCLLSQAQPRQAGGDSRGKPEGTGGSVVSLDMRAGPVSRQIEHG